MEAAGQAVGAVLGIGTSIAEGNIQQHFNSQNQALQIQGQKEMGRFNQQLALDTWDKTNYKAQMKQLEKAGLNPGLIYGNGGGGGATTNTAPGNVSGQQTKIDAVKGMGMGMELGLQQAQMKNIEANTEKTNAEKTEIEARTGTYEPNIEKTKAEIEGIMKQYGVTEATAIKIAQDTKESQSRVPINEATVPKIQAEEDKTRNESQRISNLTPLEVNKIKEEIKLLKTSNKYEDSIKAQTLEKIISEASNLEATKDNTRAKTQNEGRMNMIESILKNQNMSSEEKQGIIEMLLKML